MFFIYLDVLASTYPVAVFISKYNEPFIYAKDWKLPPTTPLTNSCIPEPIPWTKPFGPYFIPSSGSLAIVYTATPILSINPAGFPSKFELPIILTIYLFI